MDQTTETPTEAEGEGLTFPELRELGFDAIHDVLSHLYGERSGELVDSPATFAAWAAFDLLVALTLGAAEGETDEDQETEKSA